LVARGLTAPVDPDPAAVLRPRAMGDAISRAVLITGCSSGIGRATAVQLAEHGWPVYATARRLDAIRDLAGHGCKVLALDVCDEDSIRHAVPTVERADGAVGVLINHARSRHGAAFALVP